MFDNPYFEIKLHRYTSLESAEDINQTSKWKDDYDHPFEDKIIDLKDCDNDEPNHEVWSIGQHFFCPDYSDSDFLYGDYYQAKASWLRLAVHKCDPKKRAIHG